jgi:hypothetical protein
MTNYTISEPISQTSQPLVGQMSRCGLCGEFLQSDDLTAGPFDASNKLTLVCSDHIRNTRQLINLLADFIITERQRYIESHNFEIVTEAPDAWFLY